MSDMPRCKTCKWWDTYEDDPNPVHGWCRVARTLDRQHTGKGIPTPLMCAHSGNDGLALLITLPNFGCIQHQPREGQP